MKIFGRLVSAILAAAVSASLLCAGVSAAEKKEFETAKKAVANMRVGVNAGCQFESFDEKADPYSCSGVNPGWREDQQGTDPSVYETAWGNPVMTKEYISGLKKAGFGAVRLPVTWGVHSDKNGRINKEWLDRIQEVVDWIIEEDMYCILNMHGDRWIEADKENYNKNSKRFANIWKNIAVRFKDYDEKLIFEGYNEMVARDSRWNWVCFGFVPEWTDIMDWYNKYMQLFVDTVRSTGGNNRYRNLLINTYSCSLGYDEERAKDWSVKDSRAAVNDLILPKDSVKDHLIIGFHYYSPGDFCDFENKSVTTWGTKADKRDADNLLKIAADLGEKWDAPVIIGEIAASYKNNTKEVAKWTQYHVKTAAKYGIVCFWWDSESIMEVGINYTGVGAVTHMGLFNRSEGKPVWTEVVDAIILNAYQGKLPAPELKGVKSGNSVTLKWDKVSGAYGYRIYELDGKTGKYKQIAYIKGTKKTIKGLSKGTHKYKVVPTAKYEGKVKNGSASNVLKVTV